MRWILHACVLAAAIAAGVAFAQPHYGARGKPQRVVSLNLCLDQQVLMLADVQNVASVTWLAADPFASMMADVAKQVPQRNRGYAEEVLPLRPDLIVAGTYTTPFTVRMLRRAGYNVDVLDAPPDLNGVREQIRLMGDLLREQDHAAALTAWFDTLLVEAAPRPGERAMRAAIFQPGGFTAGAGAFEDSLLRAAGYTNVAAETGIGTYGFLSLEQLMLLDVDFIVSPEYLPGRPSLGEQAIHHPALRRAHLHSKVVEVPSKLWSCPGPMNAEAVRLLAEARR